MQDTSRKDLAGKVAVVTGAGSGIGRAAAIAFAEAGTHVMGVGRRVAAVEETANHHPGIAVHAADLRIPETADAVVGAAIQRWGRLDILVNNAGVAAPMSMEEVTAERISDLMAINVTAPSLLARAALEPLKISKGAIVNVSSTYGHRPAAGAAHYAASKAALEQLTRSWALELAPHQIRVNAIAPGPTESEALAAAGLSDQMIDEIKTAEANTIPLRRRGQPTEVAVWIRRLADARTTWLTGQVLTIDGGLELT